jgi:magnesium chelatase subunit I
MSEKPKPQTVGELIASGYRSRSVKDEIRRNLVTGLRNDEKFFEGIVGYEDSVVPQMMNALLARHNFILLGLRGQAKSRILRALTDLLDDEIPIIAGSEINDDPLKPISAYALRLLEEQGEATPIEWIPAESRYIEKLATPDVTVADIIGDVDPIKAAREGHLLSDELTIHYGLLPRANRGIFAINELPDLAGKIQVGLFNIMQEGDVQIKGYPVRLPLDVLLVFSANPEDYTARGKIITPLKDRIGAEIRTHYPAGLDQGMKITAQEAWIDRTKSVPSEERIRLTVPGVVHEVVERIAFLAREDKRVDKRSGVSQRLPITVLEAAVSNAERRFLINCHLHTNLRINMNTTVRISDIRAALPAITGKLELEYEGEQFGATRLAHDLIRRACGEVFNARFEGADPRPILDYFNQGDPVRLADTMTDEDAFDELSRVTGLMTLVRSRKVENSLPGTLITYCELVLEGLHARKKLDRRDEDGEDVYQQAEPERPTVRRNFDDWGGGRVN